MSLPTTLIKITAGTLPPNFCYPGSPQLLLNAFVQAISAQFQSDVGNSFYNMGTTVPTADNRIYPWLNLNDGRWYIWGNSFGVAKWITLYDGWSNSAIRLMWTGIENDLQTFDGGNVNAVAIADGPFWTVDHDYDFRSPMGAGPNLPVSGNAFTVGTNFGEEKHQLTVAELAAHTHGVNIGGTFAPARDDFNNAPFLTQLPPGTDFVSGSTGGDVAHNTIHPVRATFFIKRTIRQFRAI